MLEKWRMRRGKKKKLLHPYPKCESKEKRKGKESLVDERFVKRMSECVLVI